MSTEQQLIESGHEGDIVVLEPPNPMSFIQTAIERGLVPEQLGKLLDLQERFEKDQAAKRFAASITAFQQECPQIEKWKEGAKGAYKYAPYESVMAIAGPIMVRHGIVVTFSTQQTDKGLDIECRIRVGTHCETTTIFMPTSVANNMINAAQNQGITLAYARRNALKLALNIVERGEDTDGDTQGNLVNGAQIAEINGLIEKLARIGKPVDFPKLLNWANITSLADLPQRELGKVTYELNRRLTEGKK